MVSPSANEQLAEGHFIGTNAEIFFEYIIIRPEEKLLKNVVKWAKKLLKISPNRAKIIVQVESYEESVRNSCKSQVMMKFSKKAMS